MKRELTPEGAQQLVRSFQGSAVRRQTRAVLAMCLKRDDRFLQHVVQVRDASPLELDKVDAFIADLEEEWREFFSIEFLIEHVEEAEVSPDRGFDWFYVQWPHITYLDESGDNATETPPPTSCS